MPSFTSTYHLISPFIYTYLFFLLLSTPLVLQIIQDAVPGRLTWRPPVRRSLSLPSLRGKMDPLEDAPPSASIPTSPASRRLFSILQDDAHRLARDLHRAEDDVLRTIQAAGESLHAKRSLLTDRARRLHSLVAVGQRLRAEIERITRHSDPLRRLGKARSRRDRAERSLRTLGDLAHLARHGTLPDGDHDDHHEVGATRREPPGGTSSKPFVDLNHHHHRDRDRDLAGDDHVDVRGPSPRKMGLEESWYSHARRAQELTELLASMRQHQKVNIISGAGATVGTGASSPHLPRPEEDTTSHTTHTTSTYISGPLRKAEEALRRVAVGIRQACWDALAAERLVSQPDRSRMEQWARIVLLLGSESDLRAIYLEDAHRGKEADLYQDPGNPPTPLRLSFSSTHPNPNQSMTPLTMDDLLGQLRRLEPRVVAEIDLLVAVMPTPALILPTLVDATAKRHLRPLAARALGPTPVAPADAFPSREEADEWLATLEDFVDACYRAVQGWARRVPEIARGPLSDLPRRATEPYLGLVESLTARILRETPLIDISGGRERGRGGEKEGEGEEEDRALDPVRVAAAGRDEIRSCAPWVARAARLAASTQAHHTTTDTSNTTTTNNNNTSAYTMTMAAVPLAALCAIQPPGWATASPPTGLMGRILQHARRVTTRVDPYLTPDRDGRVALRMVCRALAALAALTRECHDAIRTYLVPILSEEESRGGRGVGGGLTGAHHHARSTRGPAP